MLNMEKKICVIGYVPPSKIVGAEAFLENITKFKTTYPLILYSDADYPGTIKLKASPEIVNDSKYPNGNKNPWARNNLIFLTGLSIAKARDYTHILYVEADVRVGVDNWDSVIVNETFSDGDPLAAGTIVTYFPCNRGLTYTKAWNLFVADNVKKKFPISSFGGLGANELANNYNAPATFPNGALGVYSVDWLCSKLDLSSCPTEARRIPAWDYYVGQELCKEFGLEVFKKVKHLESIFSGYGDVATNEEERIHFLMSGQVVAVHQIKSAWAGPDRAAEAPVPITYIPEVVPKVGILIVSYLRDIEWLDYCLTSIDRFATGFEKVVVAVPREGAIRFKKMIKNHKLAELWIFDEAKDKGHLHQNAIKCMADEVIPGMDFILHLDSDCVFTEPVTPSDYFVEGKPVLCYQPYDTLPVVEGVISPLVWKGPNEQAMGHVIENEFMRRHPAVHYAKVYDGTRKVVEKVNNTAFVDYVLSTKETFPFGFSEFNALGAWAWDNMHGKYHWIDVSKNPYPKDKVMQMWSHGSLDEEREFRFNGEMVKIIPRQWMDNLLEKYKVS